MTQYEIKMYHFYNPHEKYCHISSSQVTYLKAKSTVFKSKGIKKTYLTNTNKSKLASLFLFLNIFIGV